MTVKVLLEQVDQLQKVSGCLELVAEARSLLAEPLLKISQTIRCCANFLDVLVTTELNSEPV